MSSKNVNPDLEYDADTEAWFKTKPVWYVTTVSICPKCGRGYKSSLGHKPENCIPVDKTKGE